MSLSCPVCARHVDAPFVEILGVPVHVSALHRTPDGARTAFRGDLALVFCECCGYIYNAAFDPALVAYDAAYENSLDHSPAFVEYVSALADRLVERYGLRGRRVVEIGCGQADFLRRLCEAGGNEGLGYDPSYVGPERDGPVTVRRELYSEAAVGDARPDSSPAATCSSTSSARSSSSASLRRTLDPARGTPVYFEVPNGEHQLANGVVWDMIYAHYSTFTIPSLRALFELGGFEVVDAGTGFGEQYLWIEARPAAVPRRTPSAAEVERVRGLVSSFASGYDGLVGVAPARGRLHRLGSPGRPVGRGRQGRQPPQRARRGRRHRPGGRPQPAQARVVRARGRDPRRRRRGTCPTTRPDVVVLANPIYRDEVREILAGLGQRPVLVAAST